MTEPISEIKRNMPGRGCGGKQVKCVGGDTQDPVAGAMLSIGDFLEEPDIPTIYFT